MPPTPIPPEPQRRAAAFAGRLAAQGLLDPEEALPALVLAAGAGPGLALVLRQALLAAAATEAACRDAAARRVCAALAPLLRAGCGRARLLDAAARADPERHLRAPERLALVETLVSRALRHRA